MRTRQVRTTALASREELADAIQALFIAELLTPSDPLWIVTPWISDVVVIDNRAGRLTGLVPDLPRRPYRLSETLLRLLERNGSVVIATRPDAHNQTFVEALIERARDHGLARSLRTQYAAELHEKGILTQRLLLNGSMNLTFNGLRVLEESIELSDNADAVQRARHSYEDRWGRP